MIVIFLFIIYSLISFCPVVFFLFVRAFKRTLIKKQTMCQKEIRRIHDIFSAKTTVSNLNYCWQSHTEAGQQLLL